MESIFGTALDVLDTLDITQYLDHDEPSSISQLIKCKSIDLQKLIKYFNPIQDGAGSRKDPISVFTQ